MAIIEIAINVGNNLILLSLRIGTKIAFSCAVHKEINHY